VRDDDCGFETVGAGVCPSRGAAAEGGAHCQTLTVSRDECVLKSVRRGETASVERRGGKGKLSGERNRQKQQAVPFEGNGLNEGD
jgi:hypothetical protein